MRLFQEQALVVSLPIAELAHIELPGSVMTPEQVLKLPFSHTLVRALALIQSYCHRNGVEATYVARPEIFTHGISANWLKSRLGEARQHLCITDASAVKHIEGCNTHIFLYRLAYQDSYASFIRLTRRVPELLNQVSSQVNTGFGWGMAKERVQPASVYLGALDSLVLPPPKIYPFRFSFNMFERTAHSILQSQSLADIDDLLAASATYIPLTETSLNDAPFARSLVRHILRAFFNSQDLLLLRLPDEIQGETLAMRIARLLSGLAAANVALPRSLPPNIFLLSSDLKASEMFPKLSIVLHESFDFWRHTRAFYDSASSIRVEAAASSRVSTDFLPLDVTPIYGDRASRVWLNHDGLPCQPAARVD